MKSTAYQQAGVSLDAADEVVDKVKPLAQRTFRPGVIGGLGGFGGLFHLDPDKWKNPVLVSGTDGVGTKLKLAFELEKHDTIGIDLVAMCVNDILVQGAEPLYFLDYLACGKLHPDKVATIVSGISEGCRQSNCALIGGETAEMSVDEIRDEIGADSLHFLSEKGMIQATGREDLSEDQGHCLSCFNGKYPTPTT